MGGPLVASGCCPPALQAGLPSRHALLVRAPPLHKFLCPDSPNSSGGPWAGSSHGAATQHHSVGLEDLESYEENSSSSSTSDPRINPKTDVFNFGVILLEIMSRRSAADADHHVGTLRLLNWALFLIKHSHVMAICGPSPHSRTMQLCVSWPTLQHDASSLQPSVGHQWRKSGNA